MKESQTFWFEPELFGPEVECAEPPAQVGFQAKEHSAANAELALQEPASVRLKLEQLEPFEEVETQFQQVGVTFKNAIALTPSNPAFPPHNGNMVLMASPKPGCIEAYFAKPVCSVIGRITSSRRAIMAAFDCNDQPIAQIESRGANLAGTDSSLPPNIALKLNASNIHRVQFYSYDGQLTLGEFSFSA